MSSGETIGTTVQTQEDSATSEVRELVGRLNQAMRDAAKLGINTEMTQVDTRSLGEEGRYPSLQVELSKVL